MEANEKTRDNTDVNVICLEEVWNSFAVEEDEQRKKLWLDIFLCRALVWKPAPNDNFLASSLVRKCVIPALVKELLVEIGGYIRTQLASEDLEQLERYIYGGRGWKILRVLDITLSCYNDPEHELPFLPDDESKEFVDLLISLYQLSVFEYPSGAQGLRRKKQDDEEPNPEPENVTSQGSSVSALDVWRDTLINAASAEKGRNVGSTIENLLCQQECKIQTRTLQLWQQLRAEDRRQKSGTRSRRNDRKKARKKSRRRLEPLLGFPEHSGNASGSSSSFRVNNLYSYEARNVSGGRVSSDSDAMAVDSLQRIRSKLHHYRNPMDFQFFDSVVRSEDEVANQMEWQKLRSKFTNAPVTSTGAMKYKRDKGTVEVDLAHYLSPVHMEAMVTKISEEHLGVLTIKLLATICCIEIRWKLRQRKTQAPLLTPTHLYSMSYPLVQFAADTLASLDNAGNKDFIKVHLVELMLTSLADVTLSCEVKPLHELYNSHKVLRHLLNVMKQLSKSSEGEGRLALMIQIVLGTLRLFNAVINRFFESRGTVDGKDSARSRREDLIRQTCLWFTQDKGFATFLRDFLLNSQLLGNAHLEDQAKVLLAEMGHMFSAISVCCESAPTPKSGFGNKIAISDPCLTALVTCLNDLHNVLVRLMPATTKQNPAILGHFIDCLAKVVCVNPQIAVSSFLKTAVLHQDQAELLLRTLEDSVMHMFAKHSHRSLLLNSNQAHSPVAGCSNEQEVVNNADSDSAFYASDNSSPQDQNVKDSIDEEKCRVPKNVSHFAPYTQLLMKDDCAIKYQVMGHLIEILTKTGKEGKVEIFAAVILPLLEVELADRTEGRTNGNELTLIWTLSITEHLIKQNNGVTNYLRQLPRMSTLTRQLIDLTIESNEGQVSSSAFQCLKILAFNEMKRVGSRPASTIRESITEDDEVYFTSDEDNCSTGNFLERMSNSAVLFELKNYIFSKDVLGKEDLPVWRIHSSLLDNHLGYCDFFVQKDIVTKVLDRVQATTQDDITSNKEELSILCKLLLLMAGKCSSIGMEELEEKCLDIATLKERRKFGETTSTRDAPLDAETCKAVIYVLMKASTKAAERSVVESCDNSYDLLYRARLLCDVGAKHQRFQGDDSDADDSASCCEGSSKETTSNDEASIQVLNVNAVKEIYNLLDWMIENQKTLPDRDQVFQYAFAKLRTMPVVDKNGQSTRIVLKALAVIDDHETIKEGLGLTKHLVQQNFRVDDLHKLIDLIKSRSQDRQKQSLIIDAIHKIIPGRWQASQLPHLMLEFPSQESESPITEQSRRQSNAQANLVPLAEVVRQSVNAYPPSWEASALAFRLPPGQGNGNKGAQSSDLLRKNSVSMSLWFRPNAYSEKGVHIVSFGSRRLLVELWCHSDHLVIKMTSGVTAEDPAQTTTTTVGKPIYYKNVLKLGYCHNLTLNCNSKSADRVQFDLFVDGEPVKPKCENDSVNLKTFNQRQLQGNVALTEEDTTRIVYLGHLDHAKKNVYQYSHLHVFSHDLSREEALFLYLLGPSCTDLTPVKVGGLPLQSIKKSLMKRALAKDSNHWEAIKKMVEDWDSCKELSSLRRSLLLQHEAKRKCLLNYYPPSTKSRASSIFSMMTHNSNKQASTNGEATEVQLPEPLLLEAAECKGNIKILDLYSTSFIHALEDGGGFSVLLLLLAHAMEHRYPDRDIALVLDSILTVLEEGSHGLTREAERLNAWTLMARVLKSRADAQVLGLHSLKVLLDRSLTEPLLLYNGKRDIFSFTTEARSVISNTDCLKLVLDCWKVWRDHEKARDEPFTCLEAVLATVVALLQDSNTNREVNVSILRSLNLIKTLSFSLKSDMDEERDLDHEDSYINIVPSVIEIFSGLVGSPPDLTVVQELMQAALFLHDTSRTYISHSRNSFYFLLPTLSKSIPSTWPRGRGGSVTTTQAEATKSSSDIFAKRNSSPNNAVQKSASFHIDPLTTRMAKINISESKEANKSESIVCPEEVDGELQDEAGNKGGLESDDKLNPERLKRMLKNKRTGHIHRFATGLNGGGSLVADDFDVPDNAVAFAKSHEVHFGHIKSLKSGGTEPVSLPVLEAPSCIAVESPSEGEEEEEEVEDIVILPETLRKNYKPKSSESEPEAEAPPSFGVLEHPSPWGDMDPDPDEGDGNASTSAIIGQPPSTAVEGILGILHSALLNMPDSHVTPMMTSIVFPEYILTLMNHTSVRVRYAATRLLLQYVQRTKRHYPNGYRMDKIAGYYILAVQLHAFDWKGGPYAEALITAVLSLVHDTEITSMSHLPEIPSRGAKVRSFAMPAFLSLIPSVVAGGIQHVAVAHALIVRLHDILAKVPGVLTKDYESLGIFETLCRTLECLVTSKKARWTTDIGQDGREILFDDLHYLARFIGLRFVCALGVENYRALETFLHELTHMAHVYDSRFGRETTDDDNPSEEETIAFNVSKSFRHCLALVLVDCMTDLLDRIRKIDKRKQKMAPESNFASQFTNGDAGIPGEEVTDLLMRSLVEDNLLFDQNRRRRVPSSSAASSFSFTPDILTSAQNDNVKQAGRGDLVERLSGLVDFATDVCVHTPVKGINVEFLVSFTALLLNQVEAPASAMSTGQSQMSKGRTRILSQEMLCTKLMSLMLCAFNPESDLAIRLELVRGLQDIHPHWARLFQVAVLNQCPADQAILYKEFVAKMVRENEAANTRDDLAHDADDEDVVVLENKSTTSTGLSSLTSAVDVQANGGPNNNDPGAPSVDRLKKNLTQSRKSFLRRCELQITRALTRQEERLTFLSSVAVEVTSASMRAQDAMRKEYLIGIRDALACEVTTRQELHKIVQSNIHERGPWRQTVPSDGVSWKLDDIEDIQRIRIRLQRSRKDLDPKFYRKDEALRCEENPLEKVLKPMSPVNYRERAASSSSIIASQNNTAGLASILVTHLSSKDASSVKHMEQCRLVIAAGEVPGEVLLTDRSIHFVQQGCIDPPPIQGCDLPMTISIVLEEIVEVQPRWYQLNDCALELFVVDFGTTRMLAFADSKSRDGFLGRLASANPKCSALLAGNNTSKLETYTQLWQDGSLTNFDYLMQLNKLAGRTFNDLMQYPVFPFVLSDYSSDKLDLTDVRSFRDLRKPISVQFPEKEERYKANFKALTDELQRSHEQACPGVGPFHYGSHYSNTGIVLHFLVRLPPYTGLFLRYQDGSFDIPDRTFHDLEATWNLAAGNSTTDVKELIPDLFCLPEMLVNSEQLDLGERQNGEKVDNVKLPPWAKGDPRLFIKIHRQALESDYVRENLHHWIDLVFGYKQTGPAAVEAINVFHPATYYGFDLDSITDPVQRRARATMIKTYGQTPKQLFQRPHPMVHIRLNTQTAQNANPVDTVEGLKWGHFVGTPSLATPKKVFSLSTTEPVSLVAVSGDRMFGLHMNSVVIVTFASTPAVGPPSIASSRSSNSNPTGACLIGYDESSGWVKAWIKKGLGPTPLFPVDKDGSEMRFAVSPGTSTLWAADTSGKVKVYHVNFNPQSLKLAVEEGVTLYGHRGRINDLCHSKEWGVVVTASNDGTCAIWDTRNPMYVRSLRIPDQDSGFKKVAVSPTSADIAAVTMESDLCLFSINGSTIARVPNVEPPITAITFSSAPEGVSVNVIATGHERTGVIRLWSSWDLSPVREFACGIHDQAIVSLSYTMDNRYLYASFADGHLVIFEKSASSSSPGKPNLNYLDLSQIVTSSTKTSADRRKSTQKD